MADIQISEDGHYYRVPGKSGWVPIDPNFPFDPDKRASNSPLETVDDDDPRVVAAIEQAPL